LHLVAVRVFTNNPLPSYAIAALDPFDITNPINVVLIPV